METTSTAHPASPRVPPTNVAHGVVTGVMLALLALPLTACHVIPPPPPPPPVDTVILRQDGFDGLVLRRDVADVSVSDLEAFFGPDPTFELRGQTGDCGVAERTDLGLTAMTDDDLAVRAFAISSHGFATPEDIRVGSALEDVRAAYGEAIIYEEPTASGGRTLIVDDQERSGREITQASQLFAFDLDESGAVTALRAGGFPWLLGCASS